MQVPTGGPNYKRSAMDFIIAIFELLGSWTVGNKKKIGFILLIVSNIGWIVYVLTMGTTYGLLLVTIPALFVNIRNYIKWRGQVDEPKNQKENL